MARLGLFYSTHFFLTSMPRRYKMVSLRIQTHVSNLSCTKLGPFGRSTAWDTRPQPLQWTSKMSKDNEMKTSREGSDFGLSCRQIMSVENLSFWIKTSSKLLLKINFGNQMLSLEIYFSEGLLSFSSNQYCMRRVLRNTSWLLFLETMCLALLNRTCTTQIFRHHQLYGNCLRIFLVFSSVRQG